MNKYDVKEFEIRHPNSRGTGMGLALDAVAVDVVERAPKRDVRMRFMGQVGVGFCPIEVAYMDNGSRYRVAGIDIPPCVLRHMLGRTLRNGEATKFTTFGRESRLIYRLSLGWMDFADCVRLDLEIARKGECLFIGTLALTRGECEAIFAFCERAEGSVQSGC